MPNDGRKRLHRREERCGGVVCGHQPVPQGNIEPPALGVDRPMRVRTLPTGPDGARPLSAGDRQVMEVPSTTGAGAPCDRVTAGQYRPGRWACTGRRFCGAQVRTPAYRALPRGVPEHQRAVSANLLYGFGHVNLQIRVVIIAPYLARLVS